MSWNYENYLTEAIARIKNDLGFNNDFEIATEQSFSKLTKYKPSTIYVVVKYLSSDIMYGVKTQPVQILIISEENSLSIVETVFNKFAQDYNWRVETNLGGNFIKQQYSTPVVLSNFNDVGIGYRSVLYVSGTLLIMEGIKDIEDLKFSFVVEEESVDLPIETLNFNISYVMSGNTQPVGGEKISSTTKNVSTISFSFSIPILKKYELLLNDVFKIMNGTLTGNTNFHISFSINDIPFSYNVKLVNSTIDTKPNDAPSIQLGFMR